ncbi:hypothetical protein QU967_24050, partial [Escherichia coli]|nr:hypothetical protein [Escherichia coli]
AQIREILISESAWEEMTCLFAPSLVSIDDYQTTDNKKEKNYCSPKPTFGLLRMFNKFSLI